MKYAIIKTGGKQYKVVEGETLRVEKLAGSEKNVIFTEVLLVTDGDKVQVGTPTVAGISVFATRGADVKGDKVQIFKFKSKSRYRRLTGHRQIYSVVTIDTIGEKPRQAATKSTAKATPKTTTKVTTKKASPKKPAAKKVAK